LEDCDGMILSCNIIQTLGAAAIISVFSPKGLLELC
jgi:hypothetical protein